MGIELIQILPEITLFVLVCLILMVSAFGEGSKTYVRVYGMTQFTLLAVSGLLVAQYYSGEMATIFHGSVITDNMGITLKLSICLLSIMAFVYAYDYLGKQGHAKSEYYILGLFAILGMMVMISSYSLLTLYLGLELLALSLYVMVALNRDSSLATEAAMKYFILGALASGILLYGLSIIYGITGALELNSIAERIREVQDARMYLVFGMVFIIIGVAFKLGVFPFHMWVPDVYQGAPTSVALFLGSIPKIATFAIAIRLLADGFSPLFEDWRDILILLALLSIGIGNIVAIAQKNVKRMLAYSTVAHMGFILLGLLTGTVNGFAGAMFYVIIYTLMNMGCFAIIILLGRSGVEPSHLEDFKGLADRSPWFGFLMLVLMFSLAGVPPFAGFWGKWFILRELINVDLIWLAVVVICLSVIGAFYYLRIVKLMYFDQADSTAVVSASRQMRFTLSLNGLLILYLGLLPHGLMAVCLSTFAR